MPLNILLNRPLSRDPAILNRSGLILNQSGVISVI